MLLFVAVMLISTYDSFIMLQSIHIKLMPSKLLLGLLLAISIVACAIVVSLPIALDLFNSFTTKLLIIALILFSSAYFILRDALLLLPWSWKVVDVDSNGELTVSNKRGQQFQPALASNSFIHAACTILNFKRTGFNFALPAVILLPSAENTDELRKLRVWLRWYKHQGDSVAVDLAL
jgi:hypothetical protein